MAVLIAIEISINIYLRDAVFHLGGRHG